ncbi:hypothetical protein OLMES_1022 [Oleiphilus messinensis]|uniref:DUF3261 domain-containing protein n=1 Tax=Oleiphilus messinensis TaxID=141451 RepID=A0A1Y0I3M2_9GAMM|nr:DUF3261 domain-containing protein [Oleiphilus messinensis]ARU55108.1 hypothetical protein OLMES_1022 [Oleiphilus messinensis]
MSPRHRLISVVTGFLLATPLLGTFSGCSLLHQTNLFHRTNYATDLKILPGLPETQKHQSRLERVEIIDHEQNKLFDLLIATEIGSESLTQVGMSPLGLSLFRLQWFPIDEQLAFAPVNNRITGLDKLINGELLLQIFQLRFWPTKDLLAQYGPRFQSQTPQTATGEATRTLSLNGKPQLMVEIGAITRIHFLESGKLWIISPLNKQTAP